MNVVRGPCSSNGCVLSLMGPLRAPLNGELRHRVLGLVRNGERTIVLDLAHVPRIDAAGVGQLVRAYNLTVRKNGILQIVHATAWVREILHRVGLFDRLSRGWGHDEEAHNRSCGGELGFAEPSSDRSLRPSVAGKYPLLA